MRRISKIGLALIAATSLAVTACGGGNRSNVANTRGQRPSLSPTGLSGDDLAFSKFTEPVNIRIGMGLNPIDTSLPPGDTFSNNQFTRYLRDKYNINIVVDWTAAEGNDFNQRVSLAIASNTLPDGLNIRNQAHMLKAARSDMLYDITELYELYASSQVKKIVESTHGRGMAQVTFEGKMVALPNITVDTDGIIVMNIRKDWLDMYGLPIPRTVDDIERVARVFRERQPAGPNTIPIIGPDKNTKLYMSFIESANLQNGFNPIFAAYDLYPGYFIDNGDGTVSYGSLDPRMKQVLSRLQSWYREGLIDPEIGVRDSSGEPVGANQVGIRFAPWWGLGYGNGDSFKNDPNADWQAYPVYTNNGKWNSTMKAPGSEALIISAKASADTAAAIIITYNAWVRDEATFDLSVATSFYPMRTTAAAADETEHTYRELIRVLKRETEPESYNDPMSIYKLLFKDVSVIRDVIPNFDSTRDLSVRDFNQENQGDFNRAYALMIGNRPFATNKVDKEVYSVTYSMTDILEQRWPNLKRMEDEVMMRIITGQLDVNAFDKFAEDWLAQGGQGVLDDLAHQFVKK